jgi:hypothetical protein
VTRLDSEGYLLNFVIRCYIEFQLVAGHSLLQLLALVSQEPAAGMPGGLMFADLELPPACPSTAAGGLCWIDQLLTYETQYD